MGFKDDIADDIQKVFENETECMDIHRIDGRDMLASVDDMELLHREKNGKNSVDGIYKKKVLLYVAGKTFGPLPAANRILSMDGKKYLVKETHNEDGMYSIVLEVMQS